MKSFSRYSRASSSSPHRTVLNSLIKDRSPKLLKPKERKKPRKMQFIFKKRHKRKKKEQTVVMKDDKKFFEIRNRAQKLYYCDCSLCITHEAPHLKRILNPDDITPEDRKEIKKTEETIQNLFKDKSYIFILKLLIPSEEVRGINIAIPQTVVFHHGRAVNQFIFREGEVRMHTPKDGFSNLDVRKMFIDADFKEILAQKKGNRENGGGEDVSNSGGFLSPMKRRKHTSFTAEESEFFWFNGF